jgi:hypothetical protein
VGYQLQWRKRQLVHLGTTLVSARLAVLFGAAVHQGGTLFAKTVHGKGWAGAVAQQPLQCGTVVRLNTISLACETSKPNSDPLSYFV